MNNETLKEKRRNRNKEEIVNYAEKVFFRKGYNEATMEEIAEEAGYTKKTLYNYFRSKEEIYGCIAERGYDILAKMSLDTLKKYEGCSEIEKIKKLAYVFLEYQSNYSGYYTATFEYTGKPLISEEKEQSSLLILKECVNKAIENGEIIYDDATTLTLFFWSALVGIVNTFIKKREYIEEYINKNVDDIIEEGINLIIKSVERKDDKL